VATRSIHEWRRQERPIFLGDFWNDGPEVNGCMAGGHRYFHITNDGDLEPCVFCHFAAENIHDKTLTEALKHPFYRDIREGIPYDGNSLRPCMLIDRPWVFRDHFERYEDVEPTHEGAETLVTSLADDMDEHAKQWAEVAERAWREGDFMGLFPYPPGDKPDYLKAEESEEPAEAPAAAQE